MSGRSERRTGATESSRQTKGGDRSSLMHKHAAARKRRDAAPLGSDEFRSAAEDIAKIEVAIARLEEPPPGKPAKGA